MEGIALFELIGDPALFIARGEETTGIKIGASVKARLGALRKDTHATVRAVLALLTRPQANGVAMLHTGRCGSTVLASMLAQNGAIRWAGEVFRHYETGVLPGYLHLLPPLVAVRAMKYRPGRQWFGLESKVMPSQDLSPERLNQSAGEHIVSLRSLGFRKFILLRRDNYLRQTVSDIVARETRVWHLLPGQDSPLHRTRISPESVPDGSGRAPLLEVFRRRDEVYSTIQRMIPSEDLLELGYEQDVERDPYIAYAKICEFLGVEAVDVSVNRRRTNPYSLSTIVENVDEVARVLAETHYAWMVESISTPGTSQSSPSSRSWPYQ